ncbi:hypothetical protein [Agrobacterium sp. P15N1-A]|uniref:hypothetical protein n=1 Tax=Agrobacterium sp. P15N1-A TaxID=3342820 RepID=UPI0037D5F3B9
MTPAHLNILQHSLGLDQYGRGTFYRNGFVTGAGGSDHAHCMELTAMGLMSRRAKVELFGESDVFTVTEEGKRAAVANSPSPPKLSRGQQRYQDWLDYDSDMSFIDYVKWKSRQRKQSGGAA